VVMRPLSVRMFASDAALVLRGAGLALSYALRQTAEDLHPPTFAPIAVTVTYVRDRVLSEPIS